MRPEILSLYFRDLKSLQGVGYRRSVLLERLFEDLDYLPTIFDLLCMSPRRFINRGNLSKISDSKIGRISSLSVDIDQHKSSPRGVRTPYKVACHDTSGNMEIIFFHPMERYIREQLPKGSKRIISGKIEKYRGSLIMAHPDYILPLDRRSELPHIEAIYSTKGFLTQKQLRYFINLALNNMARLPEWQNSETLSEYNFPDFLTALHNIHQPKEEIETKTNNHNFARLAYDELFVGQLAVLCVRKNLKKAKGIAFKPDIEKINHLKASLPFELTKGQEKTIEEIISDMSNPSAMLRLVQGDVGCGKTIVAFIAILNAISNGYQSALMAPTEILAKQHYLSCKKILGSFGARVILLCGSHTSKQKREIKTIIKLGAANVIIGTHSLFQEQIMFHSLGLAIVDEQHRFGVYQRLALQMKTDKNKHCADMMVMTATPIPRTLQLGNYGDMDVSRITGKPPGRKKIKTIALPMQRVDEVIKRLKNVFHDDNAAYWVCRRIDEEGSSDLTAVETRYKYLQKQLPEIEIEMLQGKMKSVDKDKAMQKLYNKESQLVVATTVIEVGVDVPHANVMIIENAEHFGLSQLHQLRGRVGRNNQEAYCILIYNEPLSDIARQRIAIMRETDDGFVIAEKDLQLRGSGEMLGTRQSGMPRLKFFDPSAHSHLLPRAHKDAKKLLEEDSELKSQRGEAAKTLLHLFRRSDTVDLIRSG